MKFVKLFSDSQAALRSLANWKVKSKLVFDILNTLAKSCMRVELVWIKAHPSYVGKWDELARNAVFNNIVLFCTYLNTAISNGNYGKAYTKSGRKSGLNKTPAE